MNALFRRRSLGAALAGWAAVFLPFLLCLVIQKPDAALTGNSFLETGLMVGLAGSVALLFLLALPPFYYLQRTGRGDLAAYTRFPVLWVLILAGFMGLVAGGVALIGKNDLIWWQSLFSTTLVGFIMLVCPALLWALSYWFLAIRREGGMKAITGFSLLFVLWNLFCFLVAANWAVLAGR